MNKTVKIKAFLLSLLVMLLMTSFRGQTIFNPQMNTKGFYYSLHEYPPYDPSKSYLEFIFFYSDGTMYWFTEQSRSNEVDCKIKYVLQNIKEYRNTGEWGYYFIKADTLYANLFIHDASRMGRIREQWKIFMSDSVSIYLSKTICDRCKNQYLTYGNSNEVIFQPNIKYKFESSLIKPDSSQMPLRKKNWFRKEMKQKMKVLVMQLTSGLLLCWLDNKKSSSFRNQLMFDHLFYKL